MSRLRWPDSTNSVSEKPGTIQTASRFLRFWVSGAAPVRWLPRNEVSEKPGTIQSAASRKQRSAKRSWPPRDAGQEGSRSLSIAEDS